MRNACFLGAALATLATGWTVAVYADGDGSRTRPVHRIPLYDANGEKISPHERRATPFSARETCGECHDYDTIRSGWHFNSHDSNVPSGKPGEPCVLVDEKTGTALPISNRNWEGVWKPDELDMSPWDMTKTFGRHMPGGNWGEADQETPDPESRWDVSGRLDINCLACHNAAPEQDQSEWVIQTARENFRWAATAASGLGVVSGMASRLPSTWDPIDGPILDNPYLEPPYVEYNPALFDAKTWVSLDLRTDIAPNRCYFCHTTAEVDQEIQHCDGDVHVIAGLSCTDCHRNDLAHGIVRGNESDAADTEVTTLSCRGCHYGSPEGEGGKAMGGRLGAPYPEHPGLPESHIEGLTCTACHSGLWPKADVGHICKARANRLGVHGKAKWETELPVISSPVFKKDRDGKLAPHHMFWPAFWARVQGDEVTPVLPDAVRRAARAILEPEWQVCRILTVLAPEDDDEAIPVYIANGNIYSKATWTSLSATDYAEGGLGPRWGLLRGERVDPVVLDTLNWTPEAILDAKGPLPQVQVSKVLAEIDYQAAAEGDPVYIAGGKMYRWTDEEALAVSDAPEPHAKAEALWGDLYEDKVTPLEADVMKEIVDEVIGFEQLLTQEAVAGVLEALQQAAATGEPVYLSGGKLYRRAGETVLKASEPPPGAPTADSWGGAAWVTPLRGSGVGNAAYWCLLADDKVLPLVPSYVTEAIAVDELTEAQVVRVLAALAEDEELSGEPAYVCGGRLFCLNGDALTASEHEVARPYAWSFGHDVRPAAQSLGAGGCADCHADDAPFFFGEVTPHAPARLAKASALPMFEFEGYDPALIKGWEKSVRLQPITTYGGLIVSGLIAIAILRYGFMALEAILRGLVSKGGKSP